MGRHKENCQVFTPDNIVNQMLDVCGYTTDLFGKKILENSCGTGNFLTAIVQRYIEDCLRQDMELENIKEGLQRDIYAFEIDKDTAKQCRHNLRKMAMSYGITKVHWKVAEKDFLKCKKLPTFSYIVGNPPYITYAALSPDNREYVKKTFSVCKEGKPDYYYAFIQASINLLEPNGELVYIVPNNFFKTWFAHQLREALLLGLTHVYDYHHIKLFADALTSSAIIRYIKDSHSQTVHYKDMSTNKTSDVNKQWLVERWIFEQSFNLTQQNLMRFSDCFSAGSAIATLCNKAFLMEKKPTIELGAFVEPVLVRPAVSPKSLTGRKSMEILFPYCYTETGLKRYTSEEFENNFPQAVSFLRMHESELGERSSDASAQWFEYGRSQALAHLNQKKLLISTLITDLVKVYELDELTIPYSGIYVVPKSPYTLEQAKKILESQSFFEYVRQVGIPVNGNTVRISIQDVNKYVL